MLIGFVFWYRGLAQGGIAAVGQLQLLQPFFGLALAATLLHEPVTWIMLAVDRRRHPVCRRGAEVRKMRSRRRLRPSNASES